MPLVRKVLIAGTLMTFWVFGSPPTAEAVPVSAYELIADVGTSLSSADLERTRSSPGTGTVVEGNDATIAAQNLVSAAFGTYNKTDVTYRHDLTWVLPPVGSFVSAVLTVVAYDVDGALQQLLADSVVLGNLTHGFNQFTTSVFNNGAVLSGLVSDGQLNILFDKGDSTSIVSSRLDVTYEPFVEQQDPQDPPPSVPEPASLLLLGPGLGYLALRRRRQP